MKLLAVLSVIGGVLSISVGAVTKIIDLHPYNIFPLSYLIFAKALFLFAIAMCVLKMTCQKK